MTVSVIVFGLWLTLIGVAALSDARTYRIANVIPLMLILLFIVAHAYWGFETVLLDNLGHFLIALTVGIFLYALGWFGGGDAKFYAAIALWFNMTGGVLLIFCTGIAGLALAIIYLLTRRTGPYRTDREARKSRRIPYGVAIAFGAVIAGHFTGWAQLFPGLSEILN